MTTEQYNKIKEYRDILISAYEAQFVRGVELSQFNIIKMVYEEITKDIYNGLKINCSSCVVKLYSMIGEALINYEKANIIKIVEIEDNDILIKIDNDVKYLTNNNDLLYIEDTKINTSSKKTNNKKNLS